MNKDSTINDMSNDIPAKATEVANLLKLISNPHRLTVLCALTEQPMNVTALTELADINQTAMSNHLARLRSAGIIDYHRKHRELIYELSDPRVAKVLTLLHDLYCKENNDE
ncbi:metalloregulator ArsR/SmtB family transcription factor [Cardiobacteriaceae bacterium TAE3-ERU3]|nr:metalloregulator ArsR/SmtB family transcription factor [Cardiobacteriaceae bacterium TAE3-ERU3]